MKIVTPYDNSGRDDRNGKFYRTRAGGRDLREDYNLFRVLQRVEEDYFNLKRTKRELNAVHPVQIIKDFIPGLKRIALPLGYAGQQSDNHDPVAFWVQDYHARQAGGPLRKAKPGRETIQELEKILSVAKSRW